MKFPMISFVIATFNGERTIDRCLKSILEQDYPKNKIEIIIVDGGSIDKTLNIIKKYPVKLLYNNKKLAEGPGMGKALGGKNAKGDYICYVDQDNILVGKEWLKEMINPFLKDLSISIVQSQLYINKKTNLINHYIGIIGIEDPYAISNAITSQLIFNKKLFIEKKDFFLFKMNSKNQFYFGNNGGIYRKKEFEEIGGYSRENDMCCEFSRMKIILAIPKKAYLYHNSYSNFLNFIKKRGNHFKRFILANYKQRKYKWKGRYLKEKGRFYVNIIKNLIIFPALFYSMYKTLKEKDAVWILHPIFLFVITMVYLCLIIIYLPKGSLKAFSNS